MLGTMKMLPGAVNPENTSSLVNVLSNSPIVHYGFPMYASDALITK